MVITRFAPSPTGALHLGGLRTALFNYLFACNHNGKFLLRIEDTDKKRSDPKFTQQIINSLSALGIVADNQPPMLQSERQSRHIEIVNQLLKQGQAYYCYASPQQIQQAREQAEAEGRSFHFKSPWRDTDNMPPADVKPVVRLKVAQPGSTTINDIVQGEITVDHNELDDMVLLRADQTPTYMLAVVVDDHDMGITHIIRGEDHLTNAFRQQQIYDAMGWPLPVYAHLPLILGPDGAKLSKRHGAVGVDEYLNQGYLPEAILNLMIRLGWSHGDQELFTMAEAKQLFNLEHLQKAPARLDFDKLSHLGGHYFKIADDARLIDLLSSYLSKPINNEAQARLVRSIPALKQRVTTLAGLALAAEFCLKDAADFDYSSINDKAQKQLAKVDIDLLQQFDKFLSTIHDHSWNEPSLAKIVSDWLEQHQIKLGKIGPALRIACTASTAAPGLFLLMSGLQKAETMLRLNNLIIYLKKHS
ncbi:MAG: glutamate--tRNA ligase [Pseudomonadota bacterium]